MENVHAETYSYLLIEMLISDVSEQTLLFQANKALPCVRQKADRALRWCNTTSCTFSKRLIAFAAVGIFFSGAFCAIFWIKQRRLLRALCFSDELISRDKGLHCDFAVFTTDLSTQQVCVASAYY
jgi:ribonucleotide reductase beta subunit family protein with ferritin-like domain